MEIKDHCIIYSEIHHRDYNITCFQAHSDVSSQLSSHYMWRAGSSSKSLIWFLLSWHLFSSTWLRLPLKDHPGSCLGATWFWGDDPDSWSFQEVPVHHHALLRPSHGLQLRGGFRGPICHELILGFTVVHHHLLWLLPKQPVWTNTECDNLKCFFFFHIWFKTTQWQTCKIMDEVFDEVANDGVKNWHHDEDGYEQVDDVCRQMDRVPRRWNVRLIDHGAIVVFVTNVWTLKRWIHLWAVSPCVQLKSQLLFWTKTDVKVCTQEQSCRGFSSNKKNIHNKDLQTSSSIFMKIHVKIKTVSPSETISLVSLHRSGSMSFLEAEHNKTR